MDQLNSFLDKYKGIKLKDLELKEFVCKLFKEKLSIELKNKDIQRKENRLIIKISPLKKNEIILRKKELLKDLKDFNLENIN